MKSECRLWWVDVMEEKAVTNRCEKASNIQEESSSGLVKNHMVEIKTEFINICIKWNWGKTEN